MLTIAKRKYVEPSYVNLVKKALISIPSSASKIRICILLKVKLNVVLSYTLFKSNSITN